MISIEEAWELIRQTLNIVSNSEARLAETNRTELVSIQDAVGRTLSQQLKTDSCSPPFDKSIVDGYAVSNFDLTAEYEVLDVVTAGNSFAGTIGEKQTVKVMTGAPVPESADGVIMVEQSEEREAGVGFTCENFASGQNILRKASIVEAEQVLLEAGQTIQAHQTGGLVEFGFHQVPVQSRATVAVLATGDELVEASEVPGENQIRNSNAPLLCSLSTAAGAEAVNLGIARDNEVELKERISQGLKRDYLLISGGVSAGDLDLIPKSLAELGVEKRFHKVNLKPGKPLWFGVAPDGCLVFGLPGNPISSLVCFKLFVEPILNGTAQADGAVPWDIQVGVLAAPYSFRGGRRTFWPCRTKAGTGSVELEPLSWRGSADQFTYLQADCLIDVDGESRTIQAGESVKFVSLCK